MIELPEAVVISTQIQSILSGKRIAEGSQGNWPHKFAFYSGTAGGYLKVLEARSVGQPRPRCAETIQKESYMGGAVYFCPACQK